MTQTVKIRLATTKDLKGMMRIEELCFGDERFDSGTVRAYLTRKDAFAVVAVAKEGVVGAAMGIVATRLGCGRIGSVAVLRDYRGKGLGRKLLEACENEFRARGITHFMLEVAVDNVEAIGIYEANGYRINSVIGGYYSRGKDAYFMEKDVTMQGRRVKVKPS
jgi:ribosomal protein S18 acetylase RimI-like enzyme